MLVACSQSETVVIGGVFHLTGPGSFWGAGESNGAMMVVDEINQGGGINGVAIRLVVEDGGTDFPKTVTAIHKLASDHEIIIGPTWFAQAASPLALELQTAIVSPSGGTLPQPTPYFFNLWPTEQQEVGPEVALLSERGIRKIAIHYSHNDYSQSMRDHFVQEAAKYSIVVVQEFVTAPDEMDFRGIITQLKQLDVDALLANFAYYPSQGAFSRQAKELGLEIPVYAGANTETPALLENYPEIEGTVYSYPSKGPDEGMFVGRYKALFGTEPSPSAAYAYDAVYVVAQALRSGAMSADAVADYLREIKYNGVTNTIRFDENGRVAEKRHIMKQVRNGAFVEI